MHKYAFSLLHLHAHKSYQNLIHKVFYSHTKIKIH